MKNLRARAVVLGVALSGVAMAPAARAASEKVIYSFKGGSDGAVPYAGLLNVKGTLYGTTTGGGTGAGCPDHEPSGCGTVFSITKAGVEKVIYSFNGGNDGAVPYAGLIDVGGSLYGTTAFGGTGSVPDHCNGCGTVFSVTPGGVEKVVYSFQAGLHDGEMPMAKLVNVGGTLFGTTIIGGYTGEGTVFSVTLSGIEKELLAFYGCGSDGGSSPAAGLIKFGGTLYGTTQQGSGGTSCANGGVVFSMTPGGSEAVVYSFGSKANDGQNPSAGLIQVNGILYGTTVSGGANGKGAVFAVTKSGAESVIYSFGGGTDGANPVAGLINVGGVLYGTTEYGGAACPNTMSVGCGTVFSVAPEGAEAVVYAFRGGNDGEIPEAGLISIGGTLYGTTILGGSANSYGTIFSVKP